MLSKTKDFKNIDKEAIPIWMIHKLEPSPAWIWW